MTRIQATTTRSTFRMQVGVAVHIEASAETVWDLITSVSKQSEWNSTLDSIEGTIAQGETVRLQVKLAPGRTFKLKVGDVVAARGMTWSDGMAPMFRGVRTFSLEPTDKGVRFEMVEVFAGLMLPIIKGSLPDMAPAFETWAADLKQAAESA